MAELFEPWTITQFVEHFITILRAETGIEFDDSDGSVTKALAYANATNMVFLQSQVANLALKSRLQTSFGSDLDDFVAQFAPAFAGRRAAIKASQRPFASTLVQSIPIVAVPASGGQPAEVYLQVAATEDFPQMGSARITPTIELNGQTTKAYLKAILGAPTVTFKAVDLDNNLIVLQIANVERVHALAAYNCFNPPGVQLFFQKGGLSQYGSIHTAHPSRYVATYADVMAYYNNTPSSDRNITLAQVAEVLGTKEYLNLEFTVKVPSASAVVQYVGGTVTAVNAVYCVNAEYKRDNGSVVDFGTPTDYVNAPVHFRDGQPGGKFVVRRPITENVRVQVGDRISTKDGSIIYAVTKDPSHPYWVSDPNDANGGYYQIGPDSGNKVTYNVIHAPIEAVTPGPSQNVAVNALDTMPNPLLHIDKVTNEFVIATGKPAESDEEVRQRFRLFILGLPNSTRTAIESAIRTEFPDLLFTIIENVQDDGVTYESGRFLMIASDSQGTLSSDLKARIMANLDLHRALGVRYTVKAPTVVQVAVSATITTIPKDLVSQTSIRTECQTAVVNLINATAPGTPVYFHEVVEAIMGVNGVKTLTNIRLQGRGYSLVPPEGYGGVSTFALGGTPSDLIPASPYDLFRTSRANVTITL